VTQTCVPAAENICTKEMIDTEEIEYEKVCKEVVDTICDAAPLITAPAHYIAKREADAEAEADAQFLAHPYAAPLAAAPLAAAPLAAPIAHVAPIAAHAVAHSVKTNIKHACREVTTEHCVDNPKIIIVPVEVEHCHTVTKVACSDVNNEIPKTTCEAVETEHISHAAYAAPHAYLG